MDFFRRLFTVSGQEATFEEYTGGLSKLSQLSMENEYMHPMKYAAIMRSIESKANEGMKMAFTSTVDVETGRQYPIPSASFSNNPINAFLGGGAMLGTSIMSRLANITASTVGFFEGADAKENVEDSKLYRAIKKDKALAVDYSEDLNNEMEAVLQMTIRSEDVNSENLLPYMRQLLGNNAPSILVALGSGGLAAGGTIAVRKKAANLGMAAFFPMSYGGKMSEMEIAQRNAPAILAVLRSQLVIF